jgi:poly-beta-1,6-N-acetyl-D-glucosamine synthase
MYFSPEQLKLLSLILLVTFGISALVQLYFTVWVHGSLLKKEKPKETIHFPPVSIIIAARSEGRNLKKNLAAVLEQDYPNFEVIVVNHQSIDDSRFILLHFKDKYPHLKVIELEKNHHQKVGKKLPISLGIKGAKNEHLLFTDADCVPSSDQWLKKMASRFTDKKEIVIGYGPYIPKKSLLNAIIRFDTAWIAMNYLGLARRSMPYMAVGRNMAYSQAVYHRVEGFKSHYSVLSGDDDLFIQDAAKNKNYDTCLDPDTFCYSEAKETWQDWITQKQRHYSTSKHYKVFKKWMLGIYPLSLLILLVSFVTLLFNEQYRWWCLGAFALVFVLKWIVQGMIYQKLKEKRFVAFLPFLEIGYFALLPYLFYRTERNRKDTWK